MMPIGYMCKVCGKETLSVKELQEHITQKHQGKQTAGYLQTLANKYGDFRVCRLWKENGETQSTKWRSVLECWETEEGIQFLAKSNNREPLPHETFIDIDIETTKEKQLEIVNSYCDFIENTHEKYIAYETGSKGYHIHLYINGLGKYSKQEKEKFKEQLFNILNVLVPTVDNLKTSEHYMVATENVPHWKTGNIKKRVRGNWEIC